MKKPARQLVIDHLALQMRKPTAGPLLEPDEVIACGLSMVLDGPIQHLSPKGRLVRMVLLALKLAGYKIVPR
jgi:hypothetical protein